MLLGLDRLLGGAVAAGQAGQEAAVVVLRIIAPFLVQGQEAREEHDLAGGAQRMAAGPVDQVHRRALQPRGCHLAGERPLVDQVVEPRMIAAAGRWAGEVGRPDRLMGFLRILRLRLVLPRLVGKIAAVVARLDRLARRGDGAAVHLHAIGPHIGDRALLVERLGDSHGVAGREAELARCLLLEGGGGEGRRRIAGQRLGLDRLHGEAAALDIRLRLLGIARIAEGQPVELLAPPADKARGEALPALLHVGRYRPIFLRRERLDLTLALDDEAQRHGLDAASGLGAGQLAPQDRREGEADEIVERATRLVRIDEVGIEGTGPAHRLGHRLLGDGVEG